MVRRENNYDDAVKQSGYVVRLDQRHEDDVYLRHPTGELMRYWAYGAADARAQAAPQLRGTQAVATFALTNEALAAGVKDADDEHARKRPGRKGSGAIVRSARSK